MHGSNDDYDEEERNIPMHHRPPMDMGNKHGIMSPRAGYEISPPHMQQIGKEPPHPVMNQPNQMHQTTLPAISANMEIIGGQKQNDDKTKNLLGQSGHMPNTLN